MRVIGGSERQAPPGNTYEMAFILCAPNRSDVTNDHIASLEYRRASWDAAFHAATRGRRSCDSRL